VIRREAKRLGRPPHAREIRRPSAPLYLKRWGTWNKALRAAGLAPRRTWTMRQPRIIKPTMQRIDPARAEAITNDKRRYWGAA
jgi:hypothetical protein